MAQLELIKQTKTEPLARTAKGFPINIVMHSCIAIRAGTDKTPRMEHFAKMVNGLSHGLFLLRVPSWMFD